MTVELKILTNPARTKIKINGVEISGIHTIHSYTPDCGGKLIWDDIEKMYTIKDIPDENVRIENGCLTFISPEDEDDLK